MHNSPVQPIDVIAYARPVVEIRYAWLLRLARLMESRELTREEALRMIDAQMPSEQKRAAANYVIDNTGSLEALKARVDEVWQMLRREAGLADDS